MKRQKLIAIGIISAMFISITNLNAESTTKTDAAKEGKIMYADKSTVKIIGRTVAKNNALWLTQSASGIEFTVTASSLSIQLTGDVTARPSRNTTPTNYARYTIYVDGVEKVTGTMNKQKKEEIVFSEDKPRTATVRLLKITESAQSLMAVKSITVDDNGTIAPTAEKNLKIEFIGDSITCGYGVEAKGPSEPFTTEKQNATKTYAFLTAQALDADWSFESFSGFGIISGYTGDGQINTQALLPPVYEKVCFSWGNNAYNSTAWDFSFMPNLIVINLGTNDASYTKGDEEKCASYVKGYIDFLKTIRKDNPKAYIICSLGIMGDELYTYVEQVVVDYTKETGDKNISAFHFPPQNASIDGLGSDSHPSGATHVKEGALLTEYIRSLNLAK